MLDLNFCIESEQLCLSCLYREDEAHCDFLVKFYNTLDFIASIGGKPTSDTTREAFRAQLSGRFQKEHARNGYSTYLIRLKSEAKVQGQASLAESTPVGTISLSRDSPPFYSQLMPRTVMRGDPPN